MREGGREEGGGCAGPINSGFPVHCRPRWVPDVRSPSFSSSPQQAAPSESARALTLLSVWPELWGGRTVGGFNRMGMAPPHQIPFPPPGGIWALGFNWGETQVGDAKHSLNGSPGATALRFAPERLSSCRAGVSSPSVPAFTASRFRSKTRAPHKHDKQINFSEQRLFQAFGGKSARTKKLIKPTFEEI